MSKLLKNGGWRGVGEYVAIVDVVIYGGTRVQICAFTAQSDPSGQRRTRKYYELRTETQVTRLPPAIRSQKAARATAAEMYGNWATSKID